jgi:hypothetical protein
MSLVTSASLWTNDESISKKRIPSMRKTVKKSPSLIRDSPDEYTSVENVYNTTEEEESIKQVQSEQEERNNRVSQLLGNMERVDSESDGAKLANFHPLSHPAIQKKGDFDKSDHGRVGEEPVSNGTNPMQISPPQLNQSTMGEYGPTSQNLGVSRNTYSNYRKIYEPPKIVPPANYYSKTGLGIQPSLDNKLMEKINYMIHMLEQQQNERTSNITEEFILYSLLGVFIIFIVDSFARSGKYIR